MKDVSKISGRTVLFVSHNMTAIKNLCPKSVFLKNGLIKMIGDTEDVMNNYLSNEKNSSLKQLYINAAIAPDNENIKMRRIEVLPRLYNVNDPITVDTPIDIEFEFWNFVETVPINLSLHLYTINSECVFNSLTASINLTEGLHKGRCEIPASLLNDGIYTVSMMVVGELSYALCNFEDAVSFEVIENRKGSGWHGKWPGFVRPNLTFNLE